ncbi:MAG TPA: hypothetical protein VHB21_03315, partial [Minicystis sp.]|nr:hypothetical protein [Minicystis sp.]
MASFPRRARRLGGAACLGFGVAAALGASCSLINSFDPVKQGSGGGGNAPTGSGASAPASSSSGLGGSTSSLATGGGGSSPAS